MPDEIIQQLITALEAAKEHLDWCGYGDAWESECADASNLEARIDTALEDARDQQNNA